MEEGYSDLFMLTHCLNCPRSCGADRSQNAGLCGATQIPRVARAALHFDEEPCISGNSGSGAIFFSGCNLSCVFCQNHIISRQPYGELCNAQRLKDIFLMLQQQGANNINLVTPTPHLDTIREAIICARKEGLSIPIVYNTNAYETLDAIRSLDGLIDIYLPDLKYVSPSLAQQYSGVKDYFIFASSALDEMYRQVGNLTFDDNGLAIRGMLIRHLILPGYIGETRLVLDYIKAHFPSNIWLSLMRQYTPGYHTLPPPLNRSLTDREYKRAVSYCLDIGLENVYIQEADSVNTSFTPEFYKHLPNFSDKSS